MRVVRIFIMVARCSKCDFRNLGIIWDRNRWSEIFCRTIFRRKKSENFWSKFFWDQKISIFSRNFFRWKIFRPNFFWVPIPIPNFPKIPKITLRTACDHFKNTNSTHEKKVPFFSVKCCLGTLSLVDPLYSNRPGSYFLVCSLMFLRSSTWFNGKQRCFLGWEECAFVEARPGRAGTAPRRGLCLLAVVPRPPGPAALEDRQNLWIYTDSRIMTVFWSLIWVKISN